QGAAPVRETLAAMDQPTLYLGAPFGTHAGFLAAAGIPALVFGPGDSSPAHQASEWIDLEQLTLGVEAYTQLMTRPLPSADG
ncbi:MAG: M20/M25/M40 family metallo-hydrolase, partial [Phycisphaeraceae bacterium]|nr:M20/M25/M40 family metallo-hydrolase [Phycisphaeraceae bacterium]